MAFLDFLRGPPAPVEYIHAVPISARKFSATGVPSKENYVFYAFLFDQSAERAVARLKKEIREQLKLYRLVIVGGIFVFFGISDPIMLKYLPEILKMAIRIAISRM